MTLYELSDLFTEVGMKVDSIWGLFIAFHAGIFGIFFIGERMFNRLQAFLILGGYTLFLFINGPAQISAYNYLQALLIELKMRLAENPEKFTVLRLYISSLDYGGRGKMVMVTHTTTWLLVAFFISRRISTINNSK